MAINPRRRFGISFDGDFSVWSLNEKFTVDSGEFVSMGKATPFENAELYGVNLMTVCGDKIVYKK